MPNSLLFYTILIILIAQFIIETILEYLNSRKFQDAIPEELDGIFDDAAYVKSQEYKKTNYKFGLFTSLFSLIVTLSFLIFGGFEWVDTLTRSITTSPIPTALLFFGIIMIGSDILSTPFAYYKTFVIEEKFGFNKSTRKLFVIDKIKGWVMLAALGGLILSLVMWFYEWVGSSFWIYAWGLIAIFTIFINLFYSKLIVPLFNKQTPFEEGGLKSKIQEYAHTVVFELKNIFDIDGSKRSKKDNEYFSGFLKEKRLNLYDTLMKDLEED